MPRKRNAAGVRIQLDSLYRSVSRRSRIKKRPMQLMGVGAGESRWVAFSHLTLVNSCSSRKQSGLAFLFESKALPIDVHDNRMMEDAIEHRCGEYAVASESAVPTAESQIGSKHHRTMLVTLRHNLKEQIGLLAAHRQIADESRARTFRDPVGLVTRSRHVRSAHRCANPNQHREWSDRSRMKQRSGRICQFELAFDRHGRPCR
jgi:hypothetical protein